MGFPVLLVCSALSVRDNRAACILCWRCFILTLNSQLYLPSASALKSGCSPSMRPCATRLNMRSASRTRRYVHAHCLHLSASGNCRLLTPSISTPIFPRVHSNRWRTQSAETRLLATLSLYAMGTSAKSSNYASPLRIVGKVGSPQLLGQGWDGSRWGWC